ncbi:MAG: helix-hairpin-helix domain-containing protein [Clostridia bacterium]|nr:helix-hairpin-helix domain-containing protein [Clostridia bacterium]
MEEKHINIKEQEAKKKRLIQGICFVVAIALILLAALFNDYKKQDVYIEDETKADVCVHVKGAVGKSGVYYVPWGTRVNDLGEYTDGFLPEADLDGVNLARYVKDGEEIYIPFRGSRERGGYNLNTISYDELIENIEGVGEVYAGKIVDYRESHGGFSRVSELKGIIGESMYEKVREKFYIE